MDCGVFGVIVLCCWCMICSVIFWLYLMLVMYCCGWLWIILYVCWCIVVCMVFWCFILCSMVIRIVEIVVFRLICGGWVCVVVLIMN